MAIKSHLFPMFLNAFAFDVRLNGSEINSYYETSNLNRRFQKEVFQL